MPTWGDILKEIHGKLKQGSKSPHDDVRRKYLTQAYSHTGRNLILYASKWTSPGDVPLDSLSINDEDLQGLMEVVHGLDGPNLDLILHSPGGSPDSAEALVMYLRTKFTNIRVVIPNMAMSAATMIACSADTIVMGKHSFLGPTDPQMILQTELGIRSVPAQAILDQFAQARKECRDHALLPAWSPMLGQYGPDLINQCHNALALTKQLVAEWLLNFMFRNERNRRQAQTKAIKIAKELSDHKHFKSHGRPVARDKLIQMGLNIQFLEKDEREQDLFLSVFHSATHTFNETPAVKIIENHLGKAFIKQHHIQQFQLAALPPGIGPQQIIPHLPQGAQRPQKATKPASRKGRAAKKVAKKKRSPSS